MENRIIKIGRLGACLPVLGAVWLLSACPSGEMKVGEFADGESPGAGGEGEVGGQGATVAIDIGGTGGGDLGGVAGTSPGGAGGATSGGTDGTTVGGTGGDAAKGGASGTMGGVVCEKYASDAFGAMPNPVGAGLPNPASYTAGPGSVTDNVTKLLWEEPVDLKGKTHAEATRYCANKGSGWRLPTYTELFSLVDYTKGSPTIDTEYFHFPAAQGFYWSSTTHALDSSFGWGVAFHQGGDGYYRDVGDKGLVRCVHAELPCHSATRFTVSDTEVFDGKTGLTWQRGVAPQRKNWAEAQAYCPTVGVNYRLPSVKELLTIADLSRANPALDTSLFYLAKEPYSAWFWTSSSNYSQIGFIVIFSGGEVGQHTRDNKWEVRCVR